MNNNFHHIIHKLTSKWELDYKKGIIQNRLIKTLIIFMLLKKLNQEKMKML